MRLFLFIEFTIYTKKEGSRLYSTQIRFKFWGLLVIYNEAFVSRFLKRTEL